MLLTGIVVMQLAVLWGGTLLSAAAAARWRIPRSALRAPARGPGDVGGPGGPGGVSSSPRGGSRSRRSGCCCPRPPARWPPTPVRASAIWYRRTTVAARILALFLAFLIPTLLLYPAMNFFAERATRELIATEFAVQAQNHVQTLLRYAEQARKEVDGLEALPGPRRGRLGRFAA